jgi:glycogen synthase
MRIALLSLGPLAHDSRIIRHARVLARDGHEVCIFGGAPLPLDTGGVPCVAVSAKPGHWRVRLGLLLRQAPARIVPGSAHALYWLSLVRRRALVRLLQFGPDLVIANDWVTLPIAMDVRQQCTARVIYDSHEFATREFESSALWRQVASAHVANIEARHIHSCDAVMTVSHGLAVELKDLYGLAELPLVIQNQPDHVAMPFRVTGDMVTVLYQGIISPRRGLEQLIDSVPEWPPHVRLVLRGPDVGNFRATLEARHAAADARIMFEDPVPPTQTVEAASGADIGIFLLPADIGQAAYVLPNKIFEYQVAGIAVMSVDVPEIRRIVEDAGNGILLPDCTAAAIGTAISALTPAMIDGFKRASIAAAKASESRGSGQLRQLVERMQR